VVPTHRHPRLPRPLTVQRLATRYSHLSPREAPFGWR
jgi:hypothetical protein